jgi:hypothetical protein
MWSRRRILPEVAADYLAKVLMWRDGDRPPTPPWLANDVCADGVPIASSTPAVRWSATAIEDR